MIRALRRTSLTSLVAVVALFATMPVTVTSLLHDLGDDVLCAQTDVLHDADAHRVGGAAPQSQESQHCVLCHTLPSLRGIQDSVRFTHALADSRLFTAGSVAPVQALLAVTRPARAPPLA